MESLGGQRGIAGVLRATSAVAIPVGLVVVATVAKWLPTMKSALDDSPGKSAVVAVS